MKRLLILISAFLLIGCSIFSEEQTVSVESYQSEYFNMDHYIYKHLFKFDENGIINRIEKYRYDNEAKIDKLISCYEVQREKNTVVQSKVENGKELDELKYEILESDTIKLHRQNWPEGSFQTLIFKENQIDYIYKDNAVKSIFFEKSEVNAIAKNEHLLFNFTSQGKLNSIKDLIAGWIWDVRYSENENHYVIDTISSDGFEKKLIIQTTGYSRSNLSMLQNVILLPLEYRKYMLPFVTIE